MNGHPRNDLGKRGLTLMTDAPPDVLIYSRHQALKGFSPAVKNKYKEVSALNAPRDLKLMHVKV